MRIRIVLGLIAFVLACGACDQLPLKSETRDCGYTAKFDAPEQGSGAWISISRVLAEELNGTVNCGFAAVPTRVDKASVNGSTLDTVSIGEDIVYVAPADFDPNEHQLIIDIDGKTYGSDPRETQRNGRRIVLALKRIGQ